jgi:aminoglycoside phosphotransferase (APT) family kinase protein
VLGGVGCATPEAVCGVEIAPEVIGALRRAGLEPGAVLGAGVEGAVLDVGSDLVAKIWRSADLGRLQELRQFYDAVDLGDLSTPRIVTVIETRVGVVSVERKLPGRPLRADLGAAAHVASDAHVRAIVQTLATLQTAPLRSELSRLPLLPGEPPPVEPHRFEESLASLVRLRTRRFAAVLLADLRDLDLVVAATCEALVDMPTQGRALIHGDLIPANVHVDSQGAPVAVLDFGFLTTVGDPAFDAAVTASIYDMWGPNARSNEEAIDEATTAAFGYGHARFLVHRAAYALLTSNSFSDDGTDGHYAWCIAMLRRSDVRGALGV